MSHLVQAAPDRGIRVTGLRGASESTASHSSIYFGARLLSDLLGLVALSAYTRMLPASEYGRYTMVIAAIALVHAALFNWLSIGIARFMPEHRESPRVLVSTIVIAYGVLLFASGLFGALVLPFWPATGDRVLLAVGLLVIWVHSWFELNMELARARLVPGRYALLLGGKSLLSLGLGVLFVRFGWGAAGLLGALAIGMLISGMLISRDDWRWPNLRDWDGALFRQLLAYCLPFAATLTFGFIIDSSDRLLLGSMLSTEAAGTYSASYTLAKQAILALMVPIGLANFPIVVSLLKEQGQAAARAELERSGLLLFGVGLPAVAGLTVIAPNVTGLLLGEEFRLVATQALPWVALGVFLQALQQYHYARAFTLTKHTSMLIWPLLVGAAVNFGLNLWWIPVLEIQGALYATVVAYAANLSLTAYVGRKVFPVSLPLRDSLKVVLATTGMTAALMPLAGAKGAILLGIQILVGGVVFGILALGLDVGGIRSRCQARAPLLTTSSEGQP